MASYLVGQVAFFVLLRGWFRRVKHFLRFDATKNGWWWRCNRFKNLSFIPLNFSGLKIGACIFLDIDHKTSRLSIKLRRLDILIRSPFVMTYFLGRRSRDVPKNITAILPANIFKLEFLMNIFILLLP